MHRVPAKVRTEAKLALDLINKHKFVGGTATGYKRAVQLSSKSCVDIETVREMYAWFRRHGPDASNGGTSYRGYAEWNQKGRPVDAVYSKNSRGAVSYLLWGGEPAREWVHRVLELH